MNEQEVNKDLYLSALSIYIPRFRGDKSANQLFFLGGNEGIKCRALKQPIEQAYERIIHADGSFCFRWCKRLPPAKEQARRAHRWCLLFFSLISNRGRK
jgi:hypothetical protein